MSFPIWQILLGRALSNREEGDRKIRTWEAIPAMGLDGLGSASYGPEAALAILIPVGAVGLGTTQEIMIPILALLGLLYISYRQTIRAYPNNGGAYVVSRENLGIHASLLAATALMIDYVLNVAVGISAGVGAFTSALPTFHNYTLIICLTLLAFISLINLRGTPDAGRLFALPTYLFIASFLFLLGIGIFKTILAHGNPQAVVTPPALPRATEGVSLWLILRSFSAGCTAMTGVEAISNGVSAFQEPVVKRAHWTLGIVCGVLGVLLTGIVFLARSYNIGALDQNREGYQSVLSQLTGAIVGHGLFYYIAIGSLLIVLCLSANTSFVDFPRMCRLVAEDDFLPRSFAIAGRRLVFNVGIVYLTACSGFLLIVFGGITDRLIPLFAIGAFLTFTLSQFGMVSHWLRARTESQNFYKDRFSLVVNAVGGTATAIALVVIILAKFTEGAWITVLVLPLGILLLKSVKRYYERLDAQLAITDAVTFENVQSPIVLVVMKKWDRLAAHALKFALHLSSEVTVIHLKFLGGPESPEQQDRLLYQWSEQVEFPAKKAGFKPPKLLSIEANYRQIEKPVLQTVTSLQNAFPDRLIAILIPETIKNHWWQTFLHVGYANHLRCSLLRDKTARLIIIDVPWHLDQ